MDDTIDSRGGGFSLRFRLWFQSRRWFGLGVHRDGFSSGRGDRIIG
jgi:hypothetical protein